MPHPFLRLIAAREDLDDVGEDHAVAVEQLIAAAVEDLAGPLMEGLGDSFISRNRKIGDRRATVLDAVFAKKPAERLAARHDLGGDFRRQAPELDGDGPVFDRRVVANGMKGHETHDKGVVRLVLVDLKR